MIYVFISGPYTNPDPWTNTVKAISVGEEVMKVEGFTVYVPHLNHYWEWYHFQHSYEWWLAYDLEWLKKCDCLLRIPGESSGADREEEYALQYSIPVFNSIDELREHYQQF